MQVGKYLDWKLVTYETAQMSVYKEPVTHCHSFNWLLEQPVYDSFEYSPEW
jgi:hypothetical protein